MVHLRPLVRIDQIEEGDKIVFHKDNFHVTAGKPYTIEYKDNSDHSFAVHARAGYLFWTRPHHALPGVPTCSYVSHEEPSSKLAK